MRIVQFFHSTREKYFPVLPDSPHMDSETVNYFAGKLKDIEILIEYGSGGSTVFATTMNSKSIISVESDHSWMLRVQRKCKRLKSTSHLNFIYADIGKVGSWGTPIQEIDGEVNYAMKPWLN